MGGFLGGDRGQASAPQEAGQEAPPSAHFLPRRTLGLPAGVGARGRPARAPGLAQVEAEGPRPGRLGRNATSGRPWALRHREVGASPP